jgi:VanZ family protein
VLPLVHARAWIAASTLLVAALVYASLGPPVPAPEVDNFDKLGHFLAYATLAAWFGGLFPRSRYAWVALALCGLGLALEILQQQMGRGRSGDPYDMAANAAGVVAGLLLGLGYTGGWAVRIEAWLGRS